MNVTSTNDHGSSSYTVISSSMEMVAKDFRREMPVKTHHHKLKRHDDTFTGKEAVDFMIRSNMATTREEATRLGMDLLHGLNLFHHVYGDHTFKDDHLFYRFTDRQGWKKQDDLEAEEEEEGMSLIVSRLLLVASALVLLWGMAAIAGALSSLSMILLFDVPTKRAKALRFNDNDKWLLVSLLSAEASLGSWGVLSWITYIGASNPQSIWISAKIAQKCTAFMIAILIFRDVLKRSKLEDCGDARRDATDLQAYATTEIRVKLLEGRNLVPKDANLLGRLVTSDPYVLVKFGDMELGRSKTIRKTLNPIYDKDNEFSLHVSPGTLEHKRLELHIFDFDLTSADDPMGVVHIPLPVSSDMDKIAWWPVSKGRGVEYCEDASGEMKVHVQVKQ